MGRLTEIAPGVLVATSSYATTTTTVVAGSPGSGECLVIDPAVTVADLAGLAASLDELELRPVVAWSTHPHWDHVLWSAALGDAPRYAAPAAVAIAETERDGMLKHLEASAPGHDLSLVGRLTALDAAVIPWDGPQALLIVHDGHAPGHGAVFLPGTGVLVAGDMCSDIEIPLLDTVAEDPLGGYRTGLDRLASVPGVRQVVPGHGHVGDAIEFRRRLAADAAYLDVVAEGEPFDDPRLEGSPQWMRVMHDEQVRHFQRLASGGRQREHRGARGAEADLVLGAHEILGGRVDLAVARVAGEARVRSAGHLQPDPVAAAEPVRRAEQADPHRAGQRVWPGEPDDAVADVA
jgi:glyoxylase-like metal-dependent hydrolase (beta-lactamase superfamily II)